MVCSSIRHPPSQEFECIAAGCLNLLRLQFYSIISNGVAPKAIGLGEGSRLLLNLKTRVLQLAGGSNILKTIQESAQLALQIGWPILLPSAGERASTLTSLLPSEASILTSGNRFMTDLLVNSLMGDEGLHSALKQAINAEQAEECSNNGQSLPLLHLIKQLLRNNSALTQARLSQLLVTGSTYHKPDDILAKAPEQLSPSLDLLHRFQRLLLAHIHQTSNDECNGAEVLLGKYVQNVVTFSIATLSKANEILCSKTAGVQEINVSKILASDISDTLLYELLIGLSLLHLHKKEVILQSIDWNNTFVKLLGIMNELNRFLSESEVQNNDSMGWPGIICRGWLKLSQCQEEATLIRPCDLYNHNADGTGKWVVMNGFVYDIEDYE